MHPWRKLWGRSGRAVEMSDRLAARWGDEVSLGWTFGGSLPRIIYP